MNPYRPVLLAAAFISIVLLGVALYLQHGMNMLPCPLCVLQRYAFAAVALICLVAAGLPPGDDEERHGGDEKAGRQDPGGLGQRVRGLATRHHPAATAADPQPAALGPLQQHDADQQRGKDQMHGQDDVLHRGRPSVFGGDALL